MSYSVNELFSLPIFHTNIGVIDKDLLNFIYNNYEFFKEKNDSPCISFYNYVLEDEKLLDIKKLIAKKLNLFTREVLFVSEEIEFYFSNSWFVIMQNGCSSQRHNHVNSILSGVLYLDTPKNSGNIVFYKPEFHFNLFPPHLEFKYTKHNLINAGTFMITPSAGDLILFPSQIFHKVELNNSEEKRTSIAFNVNVRGDFSSSDSALSDFKIN